MNDTFLCPHCKKPIPLTQALSHELKDKLKLEQDKELAAEKKKLNEEARSWREAQMEKLKTKAKEDMEMQLKDKSNELEELRKQNKNFQEQLLELNKTLRAMRTAMEEEKLELEKKLSNEQNKIHQEEQRKFEEQYKLKFLEIEKQNQDLKKSLEEARRKAEQGSQQLQGEVQELELENILKREFPYDDISEVVKGVRGADVVQKVKNNYGKIAGLIVWESKRTKNWTDSWIAKLKEDQRTAKADLAVIITQVLPEGVSGITKINDVWVVGFDSYLGLALALRQNLLDLYTNKQSLIGKQGKKEILWDYLTGIEFKQRVEAIYDSYNQMQQDVEIEKRWFAKKWAKQEKSIRQVFDNVLGMHGDLQNIVGKTLPELKELEKIESGE